MEGGERRHTEEKQNERKSLPSDASTASRNVASTLSGVPPQRAETQRSRRNLTSTRTTGVPPPLQQVQIQVITETISETETDPKKESSKVAKAAREVIDLEAPFPPDLCRVSARTSGARTPGAFREGGSPEEEDHEDYHADEASSAMRPPPPAEVLVSATLVTDHNEGLATASVAPVSSLSLSLATATAVYGVPLPVAVQRHKRQNRRIWTVVGAGAVALVVGLLIAVIMMMRSGSSSSNTTATTSSDNTGGSYDNDNSSPELPRQMYYAVIWGMASNCQLFSGNSTALLQCPVGAAGLSLVGMQNAVCQRRSATELTCRLEQQQNQQHQQAAVLFACFMGPTESLALQMQSLQATVQVSAPVASQCGTQLQASVLTDTTTGATTSTTTTFGGTTVSYASLGRYCRRDDSDSTSSTDWQLEADALSACQGQRRTVALQNASNSLEQVYCYDAATCAVDSTCVPSSMSPDEYHNSGDEDDGGDDRNRLLQQQACVGSNQCTSFLESVVLTAPEALPQCASVTGQEQPQQLSVDNLWAMAQTELDSRLLFLQQFL